MSRRGLEILAVILSFLMVVVLFAGFDNLPRKLRADINAELQQLPQSEKQFQSGREDVNRELASDPDLFRARSMNTVFPDRFRIAEAELQGAKRDASALQQLVKTNRRQDREKAERLLKEERALRTGALKEASLIQGEAHHWIELKQNLPAELKQMGSDYKSLQSWDFAPITAVVQRAASDWPQKKSDLESRLAALREVQADGEKAWQSSDALRRRAEAKDVAGLDYGALISAAETIHEDATALPARTDELKSRTGQLYTSWDKILVDLRDRRSGGSRDYEEKIRTVKTQLLDASGKKGDTTSDESWVGVSQAAYRANERNIGMAIAHKPAGKYDTEADQVPEPAGFAYMAPVGQRNQYGYWERRDGGNFWVWYGQYALLRDLLWGRGYQPIPSGEWESYRTARNSGQTYYGRDAASEAPKYGTQGTFTQRHYSDSRYVRGSGGYSSSKYATGGLRRGEGTEGRTFGSGSKSPSFRPRSSPRARPTFRPPSGGRTFGRRR